MRSWLGALPGGPIVWVGLAVIVTVYSVGCVAILSLPGGAADRSFPGVGFHDPWGYASGIFVAVGTVAASLGAALMVHLSTGQSAAIRRARGALSAATTGRMEEVESLRATIERLEAALTCLQEGLLLIDGAGAVNICNDRAIELLGLPPDLMGKQAPVADLATDAPGVYERPGAEGRTLEIRTAALAGGGMVQTFTDITARRAAETRLRQQTLHDEVTGLANRRMLLRQLQQALDLSARSRRGVAVLHLALDAAAIVDNAYGRPANSSPLRDKLLQAVAKRIGAQARVSDTVSRLDGGEFAILATLVDDPAGAATMADRLVAAMSRPYEIDGETACVGVSVGIAMYPTDAVSTEELMHCADTALSAARHAGSSTVRFYDTKMAAD